MSFYDEILQQSNQQNKKTYADEHYVHCIIDAIKHCCQYYRKERHVKGYLYKEEDSEYHEHSCEVHPSLVSKKDLAREYAKFSYNGVFYYPYDPNSSWKGPVFFINEGTIRKIKDAFKELGVPKATIEFRRIEIEQGSLGLMNIVSYKKTGLYGYLIYVDIIW